MSMEGWRPYGPQPYGPQPYGQASMMRASDADRERAADVLKAGYAEGRLSQEEFESRLTRTQNAYTYGELQAIVADLPQGPTHPQPQPPTVPYHVPPRPVPAVVPPRTNSNATAAMVCGILTPFTWGLTAIPAVVLGHKARAEIRQRHEGGDGQALTGLVIGYLGIAAWVAFILLIIVAVGAST